MAFSIQIADANFTQSLGSITLPSRSGLVAEYIFGETQAKSVINRAGSGLASATVTGTPFIGSNYAEIRSGASYGDVAFNMGLSCPLNATMILVAKNTTLCPAYMHIFNSVYTGFANYTNVPTLYNSQGGALNVVADMANPAHTDYAFYAGQLPNSSNAAIYRYDSGVLSVNTAEAAGGTRDNTNLKIGGTTAFGGVGIARIAYAALYSRVLTASEIDAAYLSLKSYLVSRSVVVS